MRFFMPDSSDLTGGSFRHRSADAVPTAMDNDPRADEEIINQQAGEQYPKSVEDSVQLANPKSETAKIAPDDLADSIAYALDGSGPGPTHDRPNVSGHKSTTEGITGAGPDDEEETLWS